MFSAENSISFGQVTGREAQNTINEFIKAIEQVIECRRTLKYTYVFGHYHLHNANELQRQIFHDHLERILKLTEELSGLTERAHEFIVKVELIDKRTVLKKHLDQIVKHVMDEM